MDTPLLLWAGVANRLKVGPATYSDDGAAVDLGGASSFELQCKPRPGDADSAIKFSKTTGDFEVEDDVAWVTISPEETDGLAGHFYIDVIAVIGGERELIGEPRHVLIKPVVNQP